MIVVLLSYGLPRSRFCLITQGALRDKTKAATGEACVAGGIMWVRD